MTKKGIVWLSVLIMSLGLSAGFAGGQASSVVPDCNLTVNCEDLKACLGEEPDCPPFVPLVEIIRHPEIQLPEGSGITCWRVTDELVKCTYDEEPEPCVPEIRIIPSVAEEYARINLGVGYGSGLAASVGWDPQFTDSWSIWAPQTFSAVAIEVDDPTCSTGDSHYAPSCRAHGDSVAFALMANFWF